MDILNKAETSVLVKNNAVHWAPADAILVASFLFPDQVIVKEQYYHGEVELKGDRTRGQLILSRVQSEWKENIRVIKLVNRDFFKTVIVEAANKSYS